MNLPQKQAALSAALPLQWKEPLVTVGAAASLEDLADIPELKNITREALAANPDILATAYRLKASGLLLSNASSRLLPSITVGGNGTRTNSSGSAADSYTVSSNLSWEVDLWGRLADLYDVDALEVAAKTEELALAQDALVVRVIQGWVELATAQQATLIEQRRVASLEETESIIWDRYLSGLGKIEDLDAAKTKTEAARQVLANQQLAVSNARRGLEVLLGRYPSATIAGQSTLPSIEYPVMELPSEVLTKRPDIKAAWARVKKSDSAVSAANKALLPSFTLTASLSNAATSFGGIGAGGSVWNIIGSISQPVFMGGKLKDTAAARSEESKAAWEEYRNVVLQAALEVENALGAEQALEEQEKYLAKSLQFARQTRDNYEQQYQDGLTDVLNLISAEETAIDTEAQLLSINRSRLINRLSLALAVGLSSTQNAPRIEDTIKVVSDEE